MGPIRSRRGGAACDQITSRAHEFSCNLTAELYLSAQYFLVSGGISRCSDRVIMSRLQGVCCMSRQSEKCVWVLQFRHTGLPVERDPMGFRGNMFSFLSLRRETLIECCITAVSAVCQRAQQLWVVRLAWQAGPWQARDACIVHQF